MRVEVLPLDLGLQLVLLVGQQVDLDEGVRGAREVLGRQLLTPEHLDGQRGVLEAVADAELDAAQLLADGPLAVVVLGAWGELRGRSKESRSRPCAQRRRSFPLGPERGHQHHPRIHLLRNLLVLAPAQGGVKCVSRLSTSGSIKAHKQQSS